jgi:antitoxin (DNA-binding transcriptional repressor) of toxin-antitoxin stability system
MRTIAKRQLKAKMLEVFRAIERSGEEVIVTDNGRPALRISPLTAKRSIEEAFADLRGKVRYHGDLLEDTSNEWPET